MAFIPVTNCVQARLQFQHVTGAISQNVFYAETPDVPVSADLDNIGAALQEWLVESVQGVLNVNQQAIGVQLRAMDTAESIETNYQVDFPVEGLADTPEAPLQVCYTVTWGTGLAGSSRRGRSYGVGLNMSDIVDQKRLNDASRGSLQGRWANLLTVMNGAGYPLQVVSFVSDTVPREEGLKTPILTANVRFPLATQRRRLT